MNKTTKSVLLTALLSAAIASTAFADETSLRKAIEATYPQVKVDSVTKTPFAGMYEVFAGGQILYADDKLTYLITDGQLIDPKTKRNITSSRLEELTKIDVSTLPLDQAIKVVKGNGSRKLYVFSDPDCPYCKRLEQNELINITDVTIYTFLFPLEQLHPDAGNKARAIWCAPDKSTAWQDWIDNGQLPKNTGTCDTPIDKIADIGKKYNITSTPTLIFSDGKRMLGAYPAKEIEKGMGSQPANKK